MITPDDAQFHTPTSDDPTWAETNFWGFYVPEAELNVGVYGLFRTNLGVGLSTICMNSRRVRAPWDADYCDLQVHLPCPPDLLEFQLPNGLRSRCIEPNMAYQVDFDDGDGTEIHFEYRALMPPFDINDPDQDPVTAAKMQAAEGSWAWGTAYSGHFDQTGVFEGEVILRGRRMPFTCVSTMDHSWGLRSERHAHTMSWLHAHFGEDLAMHAIFDFDVADNGEALRLTHGYVLEDGQVHGLKSGGGKTRRSGWYPEEKHLEVVDSADRTWTFRGEALTAFPWQSHPDVVGFNALMRWQCGDRSGLGETQDFLGFEMLTAHDGDA